MRAARMEGAAAGRVQGVRHLALHRRARTAAHVDVGDRIQQHARVRVPRPREQLGLVRQLDQPAQVHDADLVADMTHHRQVVRDEQVGQALLALQVLHDVEHLRLHRHVQRGRGLVADQEFGLRGQRPRDRDALALPAGELVRKLLHVGTGQPHRQQQLADLGAQTRGVAEQTVLAQRLADDVQHLPARVEAGIRVLEDHLHAPAQGAQIGGRRLEHPRVLAVEEDCAAGGFVQAHQQPRHRALAAAGFTDQRQRLALVDAEADAVDRVHELPRLALEHAVQPRRRDIEGLRQVVDLDQWLHVCPSPAEYRGRSPEGTAACLGRPGAARLT